MWSRPVSPAQRWWRCSACRGRDSGPESSVRGPAHRRYEWLGIPACDGERTPRAPTAGALSRRNRESPLKRLGGGRWGSRDGRFMIESESGRWVVVDGEQTDELGL